MTNGTPERHGEGGNGSKRKPSVEYAAFARAKNRCRNQRDRKFKDYGGRGIEFRFTSFQQFIGEVGRRPSPQYSLDRINNNGHYEPGNVRWATGVQQSRNTRRNHFMTINGETKLLTQWVDLSGIRRTTILQRLRYGWCEQCAVTEPRLGTCTHRQRTEGQ